MTYQSPEFDAFGWPACLAIDPSDCYGLDYDSAREATPRWYGVSSGNGNDGVSHTWPDYYCRCTPQQAFDLAAAAMLSEFKPAGYEWAKENMTVDGESDYTISACISDPPEEESESETPDYQEIAEGNGYHAFSIGDVFSVGEKWSYSDIDGEIVSPIYGSEEEAWKACCEDNDLLPDEDNGSWSDANGAWLLIDVFPVDDYDPSDGGIAYNSLVDCFDSAVLKLASE